MPTLFTLQLACSGYLFRILLLIRKFYRNSIRSSPSHRYVMYPPPPLPRYLCSGVTLSHPASLTPSHPLSPSLTLSHPYPILSPPRGQSLSRVLCRDWILSPLHLYLFVVRTHKRSTLILKHDVLAFVHLSIRIPLSQRSVYLKIGA